MRQKWKLAISLVSGVVFLFLLFDITCSVVASNKRQAVREQRIAGGGNPAADYDLEVMNRMTDIQCAFYSPECLDPEYLERRRKRRDY